MPLYADTCLLVLNRAASFTYAATTSAVRGPSPGAVSNKITSAFCLPKASSRDSAWATNSLTWRYSVRARSSRPRHNSSLPHSPSGFACVAIPARPVALHALAPRGAGSPWATNRARMRFCTATRRPTHVCRQAISDRHCRTRTGGSVTVGNWPSRYSCARRRASSLSVLRLRCLNFQASLAVLATRQRTPSSPHRSWTQPASRHASMTMTPGRSWPISLRNSARVVSKVVKAYSPVAGSWTQATLLYLPRSIARMAFVDAVVVIVFILQAPRGVVGFVCVVTFRLPRPDGLHGFFRQKWVQPEWRDLSWSRGWTSCRRRSVGHVWSRLSPTNSHTAASAISRIWHRCGPKPMVR